MEQRDNLDILSDNSEVNTIVTFEDLPIGRDIEFGNRTAREWEKCRKFYAVAYLLTPPQGSVFAGKRGDPVAKAPESADSTQRPVNRQRVR